MVDATSWKGVFTSREASRLYQSAVVAIAALARTVGLAAVPVP
jgi:hypothetical protein